MEERVEQPLETARRGTNANARLVRALHDLLVLLQRRIDEHHAERAALGREERSPRYA